MVIRDHLRKHGEPQNKVDKSIDHNKTPIFLLKYHQPVKLHYFVQKMKKNTLKDSLDAKKDAKRDAKSSFCCSGVSTTESGGYSKQVHPRPVGHLVLPL